MLGDFEEKKPFRLDGYTYKEGEPLDYIQNNLSKPYSEARSKVEVIRWGTFVCKKTFPKDAVKTPQGINPPHPQKGYPTQYSLYEIRDWGDTSHHRNFPGERIMRTNDGKLFNRGFMVVPNISTIEKNPNVLDPFIFDETKENYYGPSIDPGVLYLYYHTKEEDDVNTISQVYMYDALFNRSNNVKFLSFEVEESSLINAELPVFVKFGCAGHLIHLVDDCLYQSFPNEYKGAEGEVPKEIYYSVNCVLPNSEQLEDAGGEQ